MQRTDTNGLIVISSKDSTSRIKSEAKFSGSFTFNGLKSFGLRSYNITADLPTIGELNRVAYIDTGSQTYPVTLDLGWYDYESLKLEILGKLTALGLGLFSLSYDEYRYVLQAPLPIRFIKPVSYHVDWAQMIGMPIDGELQTLTYGGVVDISYTDTIYIVSNALNSYKDRLDIATSNRVTNILGVVYTSPSQDLTSPTFIYPPSYGTKNMSYIFESPKMINLQKNIEYRTVDISLLDADGAPLPEGSVKYTIELVTQ